MQKVSIDKKPRTIIMVVCFVMYLGQRDLNLFCRKTWLVSFKMRTTPNVRKTVIKVNERTIETLPSSLKNWATDKRWYFEVQKSNSDSLYLACHHAYTGIGSVNECVTKCNKVITFTTRKENILTYGRSQYVIVLTDIYWWSQSCIAWSQITPSLHFFDIHLEYSALYSIYARAIKVASFFKVFQLKFYTNFSLPCMPHAPPISSSLIWSP
jgi:hypothetical protein